jgi:serine/threonine protein phosphatase PrpC
MSARTGIEIYAVSDPGKVRSTNQDQYLIGSLAKSIQIEQTGLDREDHSRLMGSPLGKLLVVADGMGGMGGGDVASKVAVQAVVNYALNVMPWFLTFDGDREKDLGRELKAAVETSAEAVRVAATANPELARMGTTLTMAYVAWPRAYVVHAGDSRCYLFRAARLFQVTRDQTMAQKLLDEKVLTPEQAEDSSWRNVLWSSVGAGTAELFVEVYRVLLAPGDILLMCTDGLYKHVADEQIASVLAERRTPEDACRHLVGMANTAGGTDNITVAIAVMPAPLPT